MSTQLTMKILYRAYRAALESGAPAEAVDRLWVRFVRASYDSMGK